MSDMFIKGRANPKLTFSQKQIIKSFMSDGEWREVRDIAKKINVPPLTVSGWLKKKDDMFDSRTKKGNTLLGTRNREWRLYDRWHIGQANKSEWFNILREAGPVTTTATPTQDLFNISYSNKKKRKENDEDVD